MVFLSKENETILKIESAIFALPNHVNEILEGNKKHFLSEITLVRDSPYRKSFYVHVNKNSALRKHGWGWGKGGEMKMLLEIFHICTYLWWWY